MSRIRNWSYLGLLVFAFGSMACSSDDPKPSTDGGSTAKDGAATDGTGTTRLSCNGDCTDYVFSGLFLPKTPEETTKYSFDFDGNSKLDNALGALIGGLGAIPGVTLDPQAEIDTAVNGGKALMLIRVQGDLTNAAAAKAQAWVGEQQACCADPTQVEACATEAATKCFDGNGQFAQASTTPEDMLFGGSITGGKVTLGPAKLRLVLPLASDVPVELNLERVTLTGTITANGITDGVLVGLLPEKDLKSVVLPEIAKALDATVQADPTGTAAGTILQLFDTNNDKSISADEVLGSTVISALLAADIDTNGDKVADALSLGIGFKAVKATIGTPAPKADAAPANDAEVTADAGAGSDAAATDAAATDAAN